MGNRSTYSTSGYRGGRRGLSTSSGGALSHGGRFVTRRQMWGDIRRGLGLAAG